MLETYRHIFADVLTELDNLSQDAATPHQARQRMDALRERCPDAAIELVWDEQAFDGSRHYDALIRPAGFSGTVSLSVCRDDALPWPLRGLQPWRDSELLRVNGVVMPVEKAIQQLDLLWRRKPLMQRLIDSCLIEAELERRRIDVTPAEVQAKTDEIRRRRGLLSAAATHAWLAASGMSMQGLIDLAGKLARAAKLRDLIVGASIDDCLATRRALFDVVDTCVFTTPDASAAARAAEAVRSGGRAFVDASQRAFAADLSARTQLFYRKETRQRLTERLTGASATVNAGDVLGPIEIDDEHCLIHVLSIAPAEHNPDLRSAVATYLFEAWLQEQRRNARVEWFWGPNSATREAAA
jgi:putative peptide maturation system protein